MIKHTVKLTGCYKASLGSLEYVNKKGSPIGPLLRKAIKAGTLKSDDMVEVTRDGKRAFLPCKASVFSDYTVTDTDKGIVRKKYVPYENPHWGNKEE
jgi:hypothetical protein